MTVFAQVFRTGRIEQLASYGRMLAVLHRRGRSEISMDSPHAQVIEAHLQPWRRGLIDRQAEMWRHVSEAGDFQRAHLCDGATYVLADAIDFTSKLPETSIHAVVTDPPYGFIEYQAKHQEKLRGGRGGVWRIPPSFDGANRMPLPRFTVLTPSEIEALSNFFSEVARALKRVLVPGGHVFLASNPLLSTVTFFAFQQAGFEKRGELIRLVQTLRGGDRPKGAEQEFPDVSMMARSCWEPWGIFRKPIEGTAADNLRNWGAGGLRRLSETEPFKDLIQCAPTRGREREIAPHPSLKPQRFLRKVVRACLPIGIGIIYDPFAGSGSTLAAASHEGLLSLGTDRDRQYFGMAAEAFPELRDLIV